MAFHILHKIQEDNAKFVKRQSEEYFQAFKDVQRPRTTLIACSDSRFHTHAINETPDNDIFMVRVIGNQIPNAAGSVEFGVRQLRSPLLLIIGHTGCGAIAAATKGCEGLESSIKNELESLQLPIRKKDPTEEELRYNMEANIHHQVEKGLATYQDLVAKEELVVVGAVYDVRNEYGNGAGKLHFININGSKDLKVICQFEADIKKYPA